MQKNYLSNYEPTIDEINSVYSIIKNILKKWINYLWRICSK